jgi:Rieske Fe-S protein
LTELQKDPITRGDFLGFGLLGAISGAILTIPPAAFVLGPVIRTNVLGDSNVAEGWEEVGPVSEVPDDEPVVFEVNFPITQTYANEEIQRESGINDAEFTIKNAVWMSWRHEVLQEGQQGSGGDELGDSLKPAFLENKSEGFTRSEREEIKNNLNVLSNSCAHLGCPVRWVIIEGHGEFLCPCHGGIYDINGGYVGGPPPRGMYSYTQVEVRENGRVYIKHEYDIEDRLDAQRPYVV